jgi:hypothetical protein
MHGLTPAAPIPGHLRNGFYHYIQVGPSARRSAGVAGHVGRQSKREARVSLSNVLSWIIPITMLAINVLISIISFFTRRTITTSQDDIRRLDEQKASRAELASVRTELEKQIQKNCADIETIKSDFLTKEDFFREQARTDRKLDQIMNILLEMKEGPKNG